MADRLDTPLVHTLHGQFTAEHRRLLRPPRPQGGARGHQPGAARVSAAGAGGVASIPNPIDVRAWPLREHKDDYLLWIGRMTAEKGPHRAIAAARAAGVPLVLAGVIQPGQQAFFDREVAPHIDGERVRFVGEVGGSVKRSLFAGARALLMPIRWEEPFGMVMVEALACGTPVIAFPEGAARELVVDGHDGFPRRGRAGDGRGGRPARRHRPARLPGLGRRALRRRRGRRRLRGDLPVGGVRAGRQLAARMSERRP